MMSVSRMTDPPLVRLPPLSLSASDLLCRASFVPELYLPTRFYLFTKCEVAASLRSALTALSSRISSVYLIY